MMLMLGSVVLLVAVLLRAALFPAEYSLAGPMEERPRFFMNGSMGLLYRITEGVLRLGGALLIALSFFPFDQTFLSLIGGGLIFGLLAFLVAPALALFIAMRLHPSFRRTLDQNNPRR